MRPRANLRTIRRPITTERRARPFSRQAETGASVAREVHRGCIMAVYTEVPDDALVTFLTGYDLGRVRSFKGIAEGVENSNYLLHADAGEFILTLYEKRVKESDLPFFIGLMEHLAAARRHLPAAGPGEERRGARPPVRPRRGDRHLSRWRLAASAAGHPLRPGRRSAGAHARGRRRFHAVPTPQRARHRRLAAAGRSRSAARRRSRARPRARDDRRAREAAGDLAERPAERRHPRRSVHRQRVLSRRRA